MKFLKEYWIEICIFAVMAIVAIGLHSYAMNLKEKLKISENNYDAAKEELVAKKLENESLLYEKKAFILSEEKMREELDMSKKEMKELKKKISDQAVYITKLETNVKVDTVETFRDSIVYVDNTPKEIYFKYADKWLSFNGKNDIPGKKTYLYNIEMPLTFKIGIEKDFSMFFIPDNPYQKASKITPVVNNKFVNRVINSPRWGFGLYAGVGFQYGIVNRSLDFGPQIGVGVTYRF